MILVNFINMKTRKNLVIALSLIVSLTAYAQKGSVTKADAYLNKSDFVNAIAEIDMAITIEKNIAKSKTWFVRGKIYQAIVASEDESVKTLDSDALNKAIEAFNKVTSMETENSPNHFSASQKLDGLWRGYMVQAQDLFNVTKDYAGALAKFEKALLVKENDSLTLQHASLAANNSKQYDKMYTYCIKIVELNIADADTYDRLIRLETDENKDEEKALETTRKAKELFPEDKRFGPIEIGILINLDMLDEAKSTLEDAITKDPNNAKYHLNLGLLHDNIGKARFEEGKKEEATAAYADAKACYLKTVEIDPDNYIANFNVGALAVNEASTLIDEVRNMNMAAYNKRGKAVEDKANKLLKGSLPYLQKAEISKRGTRENGPVLNALLGVYMQLELTDKVNEVQAKLDALDAGK